MVFVIDIEQLPGPVNKDHAVEDPALFPSLNARDRHRFAPCGFGNRFEDQGIPVACKGEGGFRPNDHVRRPGSFRAFGGEPEHAFEEDFSHSRLPFQLLFGVRLHDPDPDLVVRPGLFRAFQSNPAEEHGQGKNRRREADANETRQLVHCRYQTGKIGHETESERPRCRNELEQGKLAPDISDQAPRESRKQDRTGELGKAPQCRQGRNGKRSIAEKLPCKTERNCPEQRHSGRRQNEREWRHPSMAFRLDQKRFDDPEHRRTEVSRSGKQTDDERLPGSLRAQEHPTKDRKRQQHP